MDFARQQRDPARHVIGITFVILMHALLIWALITGLGRKVVEVIKKPLTATIIEEIKAPPPPPPPPPPKKIIEAPKVQAPVEPYVPPPDVPVPQTTAEPVISAPTTTVPPEPHVIARRRSSSHPHRRRSRRSARALRRSSVRTRSTRARRFGPGSRRGTSSRA